MADQPTGTVTLLFTDIEGSTRLLQALGHERYAQALDLHRRLLRECFDRHGGYEVDSEGDAFFIAFSRAEDAVAAAAEGQVALAAAEWPDNAVFRVRMGIHTGEPLAVPPKYVGIDVHRAARIMAAGHGGQVLVSSATVGLLGDAVPLGDLGEHRLKDLLRAERLYQLGEGVFPPPKTLHRTNLPVTATAFLGRERELAEVCGLLRDGVRMLTLTGPGGTGKTRLGLQAVSEVAEEFPDGVWWVPLAAVRDPSLVLPSVARAVGLVERPGLDLVESLIDGLGAKRLVLLVDNLEHLLPDAAAPIAQLREVDGPTIVVTSRERLQLRGEQVYAVPALATPDGVELFRERARAIGSDVGHLSVVEDLCRRLDNLPLAIELAAARTVALSPGQIRDRLSTRLDLLKAGRDADPRQQTLRATIEWSYDLLDQGERELFARLAVFAGGCTLEAAEQVCGGDIDTIASLVDRSLLRRTGERFWMLETIREYALERLEDGDKLRRSHAEYMAHVAEKGEQSGGNGPPWRLVEAEYPNLAVALDWAIDHDSLLAVRLAIPLGLFWYLEYRSEEGRAYLDRVLHIADSDADRARLMHWAGVFRALRNEIDAALPLLRESVQLSRETAQMRGLVYALFGLGSTLRRAGLDDEAALTSEEAVAVARSNPELGLLPGALLNLGILLSDNGNQVAAATEFAEGLSIARARGDERAETALLCSLAIVAALDGETHKALVLAEDALAAVGKRAPSSHQHVEALLTVAELACLTDDLPRAEQSCRTIAERLDESTDYELLASVVTIAGYMAARREDTQTAQRLLENADVLRSSPVHGLQQLLVERLGGLTVHEANRTPQDAARQALELLRSLPTEAERA